MSDLHFPVKDQPLRRDVGTLGALLGDALKELGSGNLYRQVEAARTAARRRRADDPGAEQALAEQLAALGPAAANEVVRAFSAYFGLVNMAERVHRIRRRISYLHDEENPQPGSVEAVLHKMKAAGFALADVREALGEITAEPVLTAHPTEAVRRSILKKEQRIARALIARLDPDRLTPMDERAVLGQVREEVTTAWQTEEVLSVRPTVADEVEHALFFLDEVVYRVVPGFHQQVEDALVRVYGEDARGVVARPLFRFGSWVGGDMDGNPNVGAETILATLDRHLELILRRYDAEVRELFDHLSQSSTRVEVSPAVLVQIEDYRARMPQVYAEITPRYHDMPYRVLLWLVAARLAATREGGKHRYRDPGEFLADLRRIADSLAANGGTHGGRHRVLRLIRRVETFGFHMATLDVRQDALVHRRVVGRLLGVDGFEDLPVAERTHRLEEALASRAAPDLERMDAECERVLAVMDALRTARGKYGEDATGLFIVSMAQGPDDALAVLYLARAGGLEDDAGAVPLDVAPLFETVPDLEAARDTLEALLANELYREHVAGRGDLQAVMLGYSDSNKESGIAASRWALQAAQLAIVAATDAAGVRPLLFHGRGGTASRGGSKPRDAVLAAPPGAVRGRLRVTEQGEIIHAKYGLRGIAVRTMELIVGALLERRIDPGKAGAQREEWDAAAQVLARESRAAYRALAHDDPDFLPYFRNATPIDVIERLNIGSRPASRRSGAGVQDLRAIPWVFAWTQSRHVLTGWYGVGAGLAAMIEEVGLEAAREMARGWPFMATLLGDVEMVLAKADMPIARRYAALAGEAGERVYPRILEEFERTRDLVCQLREVEELLDGEPVLQRAIRLRNPYVDPMSFLQVDLLARWRAGGSADDDLFRVLATTVQGIARGLQNTG